MTDSEKGQGSLIHVAGYVRDQGCAHPEMCFVRNVERIDEQTGNYVEFRDQFQVSEDFWHRDYLSPITRAAIRGGGYQNYFNGFPPGRIAFLGLSQMFQAFLHQVWWEHPEWRFRPPSALDELSSFVALEIQAVCTMFGSSDYPAPYVGGDVQIETISPPQGAVVL
jgi:hypothetical protein